MCVHLLLIFLHALNCDAVFEYLARVQYFDMFNDPTSLIYAGGHVHVYCFPERSCPDGSDIELFDARNQLVRSRPCKNGSTGDLYFEIPLDNNVTLGDFGCRMMMEQLKRSFPVHISYRTCLAVAGGCESSTRPGVDPTASTDSPGYCVCTGVDDRRCGDVLSHRDCNMQQRQWYADGIAMQMRVCPAGVESLCHAMRTEYSTKSTEDLLSWFGFLWHPNVSRDLIQCPAVYGVPHFRYASQIVPYYDAILLNQRERVIHSTYEHNPDLDGTNFLCVIKTKDGKVVDQHFVKARHQVNVTLNDALFNSGCNVYKMNCTYKGQENWPLAHTSNYLIAIDGTVTITHDADHIVHCNLHPDPDDTFNFVISYYWTVEHGNDTVDGQNLTYGNYTTIDGPNITLPSRGWYQCRAKIEYSWCATRRSFKRIIDSDRITGLPTTTTMDIAATTTTKDATGSQPIVSPSSSTQALAELGAWMTKMAAIVSFGAFMRLF